MRRVLLALCSLFVLTTAGTCNSDSTSPGGTIVGSYTLVSVNGHTLPTQFENETITSGSATVNANNTFTYTETSSQSGSLLISGTWSQSGSTYTFHPTSPPDQGDGAGTLSGNQLTIVTQDQVIVLAKQ